mgnify:FL=1
MQPNYRFTLRKGNTTSQRRVYPLFNDDVTLKWEHDNGEYYFRKKLSGTFTFVNDDFNFVYNSDLETEFVLLVYEGTQLLWEGRFYKTDCVFNIDDRTFTTSPEMNDIYSDVLSGMEKEFDLIKLLPEIQAIQLDKRSMIQIYALGESSVSCFFQGMTWEQPCTEVDSAADMTREYHFAEMMKKRLVELSGVDGIPPTIYGDITDPNVPFSFSRGEYTFTMATGGAQGGYYATLLKKGVPMWKSDVLGTSSYPNKFQMNPIAGSGASGVIDVYINDVTFYGRYLCDVDEVKIGSQTYHPAKLSSQDIVSDNRNFHRAFGYAFKNTLSLYDVISSKVTEWFYDDGLYYQKPPHGGSTGIPDYYPIAQSYWTGVSFWFRFDLNDSAIEPLLRKEYTLKDAYPLSSVIDRLLQEATISSHNSISFYGEKKYSQFLYDYFNPIDTDANYKLFITQKTNILAGEYEQPAQKAVITLRQVLDMLRDAFRCYWWIEWDGEEGEYMLRIEHISYFMNGGAYFSTPNVGIDLTQLVNPRNGKNWSYMVNQVKYNKDELPERYEFKWADDTTEYFEGNPIEIVSKFVKSGEIESVAVNRFNSDLDYMLLNPSASESDGFALISAVENNGKWKVPYLQVRDDITLQNGFLSFFRLQKFYLYDMPAWSIKVNGVQVRSNDIKKSMTQEVICPYRDFNLQELVRTEVGDGQIDAVTMNIDSKMLEISLVFTPK